MDESEQQHLPHPAHQSEGHTDSVYVIKLRGSSLVSGSADKTIRVWNIDTQRLVRGPLEGHKGSVVCLQFDESPSQDIIASGSVDGSIIVRQFSTGNIIKKLENAHESAVLSLDFNSKVIVSGSRDTRIKLWNRCRLALQDLPEYMSSSATDTRTDLSEYNHLATLEGHRGPVLSVLIYEENIISGSGDGTIAMWDLRNGQLVRKILTHQRGIADIKYDGRFIVTGSSDNTCRVYDTNLDTEIACLRGHINVVRSVSLLSSEHSSITDVVTGSYDGTIRHWKHRDGAQWECRFTLDCCSFNLDGTTNVLDHNDPGDGNSRRVFDIQADSTKLVAAGSGPSIKLWKFSQA